MFKQIVTDLIGQQLESFIENFDSNSIHFTGFPSSNLRLNHLRIKPDALSALQLPVVLKHGYVGSLHVVIPFAGLKSTPVQAWSSADQPLHGRVTLKPVTLKHLSTAQQYYSLILTATYYYLLLLLTYLLNNCVQAMAEARILLVRAPKVESA